MDKYKDLRQDEIKKVGLRLGTKKLRELTARQIFTSKEVGQPPVSAFAKEEYVMNEYQPKPQKPLVGTQTRNAAGTKVQDDFGVYTKTMGSKLTTSKKVFIQPVASSEKVGPKWGA